MAAFLGPAPCHRSTLGALGALLLALLALGSFAPAAEAGTASDRPLLFSFDGSDASAGAFTGVNAIDIDQAGDTLYVVDEGRNVVDKFDLSGQAQDFGATSSSSLDPGFSFSQSGFADIAVDNSAANPGRLHVMSEFGPMKAFGASGVELWELSGFGDICGLAVDSAGHPWIGDFENSNLHEYESNGVPPAEVGSVPTSANACRLDLDFDGNQYVNNYQGSVDKYEGGLNVATLDAEASRAVTVDQSGALGHIFTLHEGSFNEYDSTGVLIGSYGTGTIAGGQGIAYDKALDRVYVSDVASNSVAVYGPAVTGTVPDLTIEPATEIGVTTATLHGKVNAQGVNNSWHFEWKTESQGWGEAASSPAASVPLDSSDHAVSFEAAGLVPNTAYEFRLVASNTDLGLSAASAVETFSNVRPAAVTLPAAPRTDTTARLNASIETHGVATTYRFEYSQDGTAWTVLADHEVPAGGSGALIVSEGLAGLEPGTAYSSRVVASNAGGSAVPQGGDLTFTTRTTAEVAAPSSCPNEAIRAAQHSGYLGECRGLELVNTPDKGNQNIAADVPYIHTSPSSPDGEEMLWSLVGGAPSGNTGTGATFLARRGADGWGSRSLVPAAAQQVGGGEFKYELESVAADFSKFIFLAGKSSAGAASTPSLVRLDADQSQDVLRAYPNVVYGKGGSASLGEDVSDDGSHVFFTNPETRQLEDVGGGVPEVISVMPDETVSACGLSKDGAGFAGPKLNGERGAAVNWRPGYHRFATGDGSRVYFQVQANGDCGGSAGLYERNREADETTLIDPGAGGHDSYLIRATPDGRSAYFVTYSELDAADTNSGADVYRWDEGPGASTCLTCVVANADLRFSNSAPVPVLVSDDFSHIYFQSERQLVADRGTVGDSNIYVLSGGAVGFVADAAANENPMARMLLSPDGDVFLFDVAGTPGITSDAVVPQCPNPESGGAMAPCKQLYRYDDRDDSVECLSCASGAVTTAAVGTTPSLEAAFDMSEEGDLVAFVTATKLVPQDVNNGIDVYQWRDGVPRLLTDGISTIPNSASGGLQVRSISPDGRDVFFSIVDPGRTGFERDGLANLYDARVNGGFALPLVSGKCSEESCQGSLQAAPGVDRPGSANFQGHGNVPEGGKQKPCARKQGKAKRRCQRKHGSGRHQKKKAKHDPRGAK